MCILRSIIPKQYTGVRNTYSRSSSQTLKFGSRPLCLTLQRCQGSSRIGRFTVRGYVGLLGNWGVCGIKSLLLKVFVKQNSCCVTVWRKLRSHCLSLCNHHKGTYQQSGSITHPHKQTVMSVNEAELQPLKSETWLLWCSLMKANNGAEY